MSLNNILNALIALVEDRPQSAREILRAPGQNINASEVYQRLSGALQDHRRRAASHALKQVILQTLRIDPDKGRHSDWTDRDREMFLEGVAEVERIVDNAIADLET